MQSQNVRRLHWRDGSHAVQVRVAVRVSEVLVTAALADAKVTNAPVAAISVLCFVWGLKRGEADDDSPRNRFFSPPICVDLPGREFAVMFVILQLAPVPVMYVVRQMKLERGKLEIPQRHLQRLNQFRPSMLLLGEKIFSRNQSNIN
jgi:hypothetical protein